MNSNSDITPIQVLQKYWKHDNFRDVQEEIINAVLTKNDVIALLPTGGGKSICYQIPALLSKGVCIVISPLIALMHDQINGLQKKGIKAIAITSKLTEKEIIIAFDNMRFGNIKFLYLSPEKLQSEFIQQKIKQLDVNLIAVDEAHCISEWGHDFRPSYLKIITLRTLIPNANFIALTATATTKITQDIVLQLQLEQPIVFKKTFKRENLAYQVFKTEDLNAKLRQILTKIKKPSIIYVNSRKQTKSLSNYLNRLHFKSTYYNGGMNIEAKELAFNDWMNEKKQIIVATNAFGMGIDKDNVAVVIHLDLPNSIENYIQEAGRAGRNGKKAFSVILYNENSILEYNKRIQKGIIEIDFLKKLYFNLNQHLKIGIGEVSEKKYLFDIQEFNSKYSFDIIKTFNALQMLEKEGVLNFDQNYHKRSSLRFCTSHKRVLEYASQHKNTKPIIQLLLRSYGGIFDNKTLINEYLLAKKIQLNKSTIVQQLNQLNQDKIVVYEMQSFKNYLQFLVMREDDKTINRISKNILQRNKLKIKKTTSVTNYITNNEICRSIQLLSYFEELNLNTCGICEICLKNKTKKIDLKLLSKNILSLFNNHTQLTTEEILNLLPEKEEFVLKVLQILQEQNVLLLNEDYKYILI